MSARCNTKAISRRGRPLPACSKSLTASGEVLGPFPLAGCGSKNHTPPLTPNVSSSSLLSAPKSRRSASAPKCFWATKDLRTAPRLASAACPKSRSALPWFLRKVLVPLTTTTAATRSPVEPVSDESKDLAFSCPLPQAARDRILLGHGSGGKLSGELLKEVFLPAFGNPVLNQLEDQAI